MRDTVIVLGALAIGSAAGATTGLVEEANRHRIHIEPEALEQLVEALVRDNRKVCDSVSMAERASSGDTYYVECNRSQFRYLVRYRQGRLIVDESYG